MTQPAAQHAFGRAGAETAQGMGTCATPGSAAVLDRRSDTTRTTGHGMVGGPRSWATVAPPQAEASRTNPGSDRPRLLDLFCGAGGSAAGYVRAGFDVVGVDIRPQPHYLRSGASEFHQADALTFPLDGFDAIHASPPCQRYSVATVFHPGRQAQYPDLVGPCRKWLESAGVPFVIENVMGAPLRNPIMLCGTMFAGLRVYRHRNFESSPAIYWPPTHHPHPERPAEVGRAVPVHGWMTVVGHFSDVAAARRAMGIDWMNRDELRQAIPPAYTAWIGEQLMRAIAAERVA